MPNEVNLRIDAVFDGEGGFGAGASVSQISLEQAVRQPKCEFVLIDRRGPRRESKPLAALTDRRIVFLGES